MSLGKRIEIVRKQLGFTQTQFADRFKVSQNAISAWEKDKSEPDSLKLLEISKLGKVTLDWLISGIESTFKPPNILAERFSPVYSASGTWFPVVAKVTAGDRQIFEDNITDEIFIPIKRNGKCFAVLVEGDSMDGGDNPIREGDYVLIDPGELAIQGDIVVIVYNGRQLVKKFSRIVDNSVELTSFNPEHHPMYVLRPDIDKLYRVIYHQPKGKKL